MNSITVLNLGAGVQSSTLLLMSCLGELPPLDAAIFADTGWEPRAVYQHLDFLEDYAQRAHIPLYRVHQGNLQDDLRHLATEATSLSPTRIDQPPFYVHPEGPLPPQTHTVDTLWGPEFLTIQPQQKTGRLFRKCTKKYKLDPIRRQIRQLRQAAHATTVIQWIGISLDEVGRMKPSDVRYITHQFPLIERRMTRADCLAWNAAHGFPEPPKSSCLGCPFHSDSYWNHLKTTAPDEWNDTVAMDHLIRHGIPGVTHPAYMHRSCQPLDQVSFQSTTAATPTTTEQLWLGECDGVCWT